MAKLISLFDIDQKSFRPMEMHESKAMISMTMTENQTGGTSLQEYLEKAKSAGFSAAAMLLPRLIKREVKITGEAAIWIATLCSRPGDVTMWAWSLFDYGRKHPDQTIKIMDLAQLMPMGVPSDNDYHKVWDAQKIPPVDHELSGCGTDNLLDHPSSWS